MPKFLKNVFKKPLGLIPAAASFFIPGVGPYLAAAQIGAKGLNNKKLANIANIASLIAGGMHLSNQAFGTPALFAKGAAPGSASLFGSAAKAAPIINGAGATPYTGLLTKGAAAASAASTPGMLSSILSNPTTPFAALALAGMVQSRGLKKDRKDHNQDIERRENQTREDRKPRDAFPANSFYADSAMAQYKKHQNQKRRRGFHEGGPVKKKTLCVLIPGDHPGAADTKNYNTTRKGDYIIDATSVASAGDGNTKAGLKAYEMAFKELLSGVDIENFIDPKPPIVKTALSSGEIIVPYYCVNALASLIGGDNAAGSRIFDAVIEQLRKDKSHHPSTIPDEAGNMAARFLKEMQNS